MTEQEIVEELKQSLKVAKAQRIHGSMLLHVELSDGGARDVKLTFTQSLSRNRRG